MVEHVLTVWERVQCGVHLCMVSLAKLKKEEGHLVPIHIWLDTYKQLCSYEQIFPLAVRLENILAVTDAIDTNTVTHHTLIILRYAGA